MLREIRWSDRAINEWVKVLEYWKNRNKSNTYSKKLDSLFKEGIAIIVKAPEIGKPTNYPFLRIKIIRDYLIYYRIDPDYIEIITIWDSRRNPIKFKI